MYYLFCGECYYPGGGVTDYAGSFTTLEAAQAAYGKVDNVPLEDCWAHVAQEQGGRLVVVSKTGNDGQWQPVA